MSLITIAIDHGCAMVRLLPARRRRHKVRWWHQMAVATSTPSPSRIINDHAPIAQPVPGFSVPQMKIFSSSAVQNRHGCRASSPSTQQDGQLSQSICACMQLALSGSPQRLGRRLGSSRSMSLLTSSLVASLRSGKHSQTLCSPDAGSYSNASLLQACLLRGQTDGKERHCVRHNSRGCTREDIA